MPTVELDAEAVRRELERVLESAGFVRNPRLCRFLRLVVGRHLEGRNHELKESVIGTEVFLRKPDYDPKADAIVRTEARRLRALLNEYYLGEGKENAVMIDLPRGGYVPVVRSVGPAERGSRVKPARHWVRLGIGVVLAGVGAVVGWTRFGTQNALIPIAVLPLVNVSQDPAEDYFAEGLTSELISDLSIIEGLAVRSQTSSFVFKTKPHNVGDADNNFMRNTSSKDRSCAKEKDCESWRDWCVCVTTSPSGRAGLIGKRRTYLLSRTRSRGVSSIACG